MKAIAFGCPVLVLLLFARGAAAQPYARAELLMEPADLVKDEALKKFRVLDARTRAKYTAGHIPEAVWVDTAEWAKVFAKTQDADEWQKRLARVGVGRDTPVVVYSDDVRESARLWWLLRYWGVAEVRLLNGGWTGWQTANGAVSKEDVKMSPIDSKAVAQPNRLATKEHVLEQLKGKQTQIIDTRSKGEHCGDVSLAKRGGTIPGSVHLEWLTVVDEKSQRFKSAAELQKLFRDAGLQLDQPTLTYCQSGGRASVTAFALELMGAKDVRNYYRSWAEWGNDPDVPVVKPLK